MGQLKIETCAKCNRPLRFGPSRVVFCPACEPGVSKRIMWCSDCNAMIFVVKAPGRSVGVTCCLAKNDMHQVDLQSLELRPL